MIPFLTTMLLMTITFALVNSSIDREEGNHESLGRNFLNQYLVIFGENWDNTASKWFIIRTFLYILFTILMNIVMLNLLIAIISDNYDRVQATQKSTNLRAKCGILKDFGQLEVFFRKRFLCEKFVDGETLYIHRFVPASLV